MVRLAVVEAAFVVHSTLYRSVWWEQNKEFRIKIFFDLNCCAPRKMNKIQDLNCVHMETLVLCNFSGTLVHLFDCFSIKEMKNLTAEL